MMSGTVNADLEARLRLTVRDSGGKPQDVDAVIDTGFNGFLTLPPGLITALGVPWLCRQEGLLADGSVLPFDVYVAKVAWNGKPRSVEVEATDSPPLVGMALMQGSDFRIQVVPGGPVTIAELP
jgi:clan AA aspartic protease